MHCWHYWVRYYLADITSGVSKCQGVPTDVMEKIFFYHMMTHLLIFLYDFLKIC